MEIVIKRTYGERGTNGDVYVCGDLICHSIELPWRNNARRVSCIPEGRYLVVRRWSQKYKEHLHVLNVPGRDFILIHPANNATTELAGCIAPVTTLAGQGRGLRSRLAFERLKGMALDAIKAGKIVTLIIEKK